MKIKFLGCILSCFLLSSVVQAANPPSQINLNTADAKTLSKSIKGIGIKRAQSIIKYREAHNGFKSVTDLSDVPLIGKNFVNSHLEEIQKVFSVK